jgi:FeS assembly SUF system protein
MSTREPDRNANPVAGEIAQGDAASSNAAEPAAPSTSPVDQLTAQATEARVLEAIRTCYDPEIPVNIYDLGLIYDVSVDAAGVVMVEMTLTSPACPVAGSLPIEVENKVRSVDGVTDAKVEIVWDPPWSPDRMSEAARLQLNI